MSEPLSVHAKAAEFTPFLEGLPPETGRPQYLPIYLRLYSRLI
jgi:hypothetical protein